LAATGRELEKPAQKSFVEEGRISERGLRKALTGRDEMLRGLAAAARRIDRSAFGKEEGFGQAQQALCKALNKASPNTLTVSWDEYRLDQTRRRLPLCR